MVDDTIFDVVNRRLRLDPTGHFSCESAFSIRTEVQIFGAKIHSVVCWCHECFTSRCFRDCWKRRGLFHGFLSKRPSLPTRNFGGPSISYSGGRKIPIVRGLRLRGGCTTDARNSESRHQDKREEAPVYGGKSGHTLPLSATNGWGLRAVHRQKPRTRNRCAASAQASTTREEHPRRARNRTAETQTTPLELLGRWLFWAGSEPSERPLLDPENLTPTRTA